MRQNHIIRVKQREANLWTLTSDRGFQISAHPFFTGLQLSPGSPCCGSPVVSLDPGLTPILRLGCHNCRRPAQDAWEQLKFRTVTPILIAHKAFEFKPNPLMLNAVPPSRPSEAEVKANRMMKICSIYGWLCFHGQNQIRGSYCEELLSDLETFVESLEF